MTNPQPCTESEFNLMRIVTRPSPEQVVLLGQFLMYTDMHIAQIALGIERAFDVDELRELRSYISATILDRENP